MHALGGRRVGRFDEAKRAVSCRIVPVSQEFDPEFILDGDVALVRFGHAFSRRAEHVVTVHKDRH
jgi:hypothetical protein